MNFAKKININNKKWLAVLGWELFFCVVLFLFFLAFLNSLSAKAAMADEPRESRTFFIDNSYDYNNRLGIKATLRNISANAYFYVEDNYYDNLTESSRVEFNAKLNALAKDFDNIIYPKTRETFGYEWSPGIDNDSRITILLTRMKENVGGYFNPLDEYKKENVFEGRSNEREMIYINADFISNQRINSFLAHEFQHMITWFHKTKLKGLNDNIWLNESRSEYASTAIGYDDNYSSSNLKARVDNFLKNQKDSLLEWKNNIIDYSSVNLFSQYLADRFGKTIFKSIMENDKTGAESIDKALTGLKWTNANFENVFTDWTIANYLNDKKLSAGNKYGYFNSNLSYNNFHLSPTESYIVSDYAKINFSSSMKDWSSSYYEFKANENSRKNILEVNFNGEDMGNFALPYIVFYKDGTKKVNYLSLNKNQDTRLSLADFGINVSSLVIIPSSQKNRSINEGSAGSYSFSIFAETMKNKKQSNGSILKSIESPRVYSIENNKKRWITSVSAFVSNGYDWEDIVLVLQDELDAFEDGENIYPVKSILKQSGSLIRGSGYKVYFVDGEKKRWITTKEIFIDLGYNWNEIISISDSELSLYDNGEDIK